MTRITTAMLLAGALALGPAAHAEDGASAPTGTAEGAQGAPPVVEAAPARPVDLTQIFRSLGLVGPGERVTKLLSMEPTSANIRDLLRLLADMPEVEIEVQDALGKAQKRVCKLPGDVGPAHRGEMGGAEDGEMEALSRSIGGVRADQREKIRAALKEGQDEFERRLMKASERGEKDIAIIEKIGVEVSRAVGASIRKVLDPDQQKKFDAYMKERMEDPPPPPDAPGGAKPRPPAEPPTPTARPA